MSTATVVVSDIDDTIKWSHILGPEVVVDGLNYHLAFKGMPELYTSLASAGARIYYVTGAPDIIVDQMHMNAIPEKVVSTNHFPAGQICLHARGESTEDFKVATITKIMKDPENSACEFILIGDNGEKDVETYTRVRQDPEIGSRVKEVFIHKIYNGGSSLKPMADQHPFVTAADLAAMLYGLSFIDAEDLANVVKIVSQGMNDKGQDHNLTLPFASQLVPDQVDAIYGSLPITIDSATAGILADIHNLILEQAKQGPRRF